MTARMNDPQAIREFVFAGNARLTLVSHKTEIRFTYRVRATDGSGPASHFVGVLTDPDNVTGYTYLGLFRHGSYEHGGKSPIDRGAPSALAFAWFARKVLGSNVKSEIPADLEVWHEGRCGRCGRVLTVPESIARGIGPECAGRL